MDTMAPILAAHPFFKGLDSRHLNLILECASGILKVCLPHPRRCPI